MQDITPAELALFSSAPGRLVVRTYYDDELMTEAAGLPIAGGSVTFNGDAARQSSAELLVADPSGLLIPQAYRAALSPFGAYARIEYTTELSGAVATKPLGTFRIDAIPNLEEYLDLYRNGRWAHRGATIKVKLEGLLADVDDDKFEAPTQLVVGESIWDTFAELARTPITETLDDGTITRPLVFDESRLDALYALAAMLEAGAVPYETPDGTIAARSAADVASVADGSAPADWDIPFGPEGRVLVPPRTLSRGDFANVFITKGETDDQRQVVGRAVIGDGPLAAGGPMGFKPSIIKSDLVDSDAAALADATARRDAFLEGAVSDVELSCMPNPAVQVGDVATFGYFDRTFVGEVVKATFNHQELMRATVRTPVGLALWA